MVLYLFVIRFSLCCCTMPCHNFSLLYLYSLFVFFFFTCSKCLGYDEEALEMKMRTQKKKLTELLRSSDFSIGAAHRVSSGSTKRKNSMSEERRAICKRVFCTFANTTPGVELCFRSFFSAKAFCNRGMTRFNFSDLYDLI